MIKYYNGEMYRIPQAFEDEVRAEERAKVIDDVIALARAEIDFESQAEQKRFVEYMEQLKEQKNYGTK